MMSHWRNYLILFAAFLSFLLSVYLWFGGQQSEGALGVVLFAARQAEGEAPRRIGEDLGLNLVVVEVARVLSVLAQARLVVTTVGIQEGVQLGQRIVGIVRPVAGLPARP